MNHDCPVDISDGPCGECQNEKENSFAKIETKNLLRNWINSLTDEIDEAERRLISLKSKKDLLENLYFEEKE